MIEYSIFDPTGNITALVESPVERARQPEAAAWILQKHPEVEQVGFVDFGSRENTLQGSLRMAGGEFCGNASMSAAALCALRSLEETSTEMSVCLRVSGAQDPVAVRLIRTGKESFRAEVQMPPVLGIADREFEYGGRKEKLPAVRMEGISHIMIGEGSPFYGLKENPQDAEAAVRRWCGELDAAGLGLMFLSLRERRNRGKSLVYDLTPLVFIPAGDTVYWEHSCASGTACCGMYVGKREGDPAAIIAFSEPGGILTTMNTPKKPGIILGGNVRYTGTYTF